MTKLLDDAIKKVRELPESDQDEAAEMLLAVASKHNERVRLDEETRAAVQEGRDQAPSRRVREPEGHDRILQAAWGQAARGMKVRYTRRAQADLEAIFAYLDARAPAAALSVKSTIERRIAQFETFPLMAPERIYPVSMS
jgi:hypothetical protein